MGIVDIAPWIVLAASICGLAFAMYKFFWVKKQPEGTKEMANISAKIRKGAMAYLKRQYKTVGIFFIVMLIIICVNLEREKESLAVQRLVFSHGLFRSHLYPADFSPDFQDLLE